MDSYKYYAEKLTRLADHVWLFARDSDDDVVQPNVGIISAENQSILIDSGNSPRHARRIIHAMLDNDLPPVRTVIYTHHHWDHTFGGDAYNTRTIAHQKCRDHLVKIASKPWSQSYLQEEVYWNPLLEASRRAMARAIDDWRSFRVHVPDVTFSNQLELHCDGVTLKLWYVGGQHADDSIVVEVKEAGVLFLGDCFYPPPMPNRQPGDTLDAAMLRRFLKDDVRIYVDGHGDPFDANGIHERIAEAEQHESST